MFKFDISTKSLFIKRKIFHNIVFITILYLCISTDLLYLKYMFHSQKLAFYHRIATSDIPLYVFGVVVFELKITNTKLYIIVL